jgi:hypothetical protein
MIKIVRLRDNKIITKEELAKEINDSGQRIDYLSIECISRDCEVKIDSSYFILDENGSYATIDKTKYKITEV